MTAQTLQAMLDTYTTQDCITHPGEYVALFDALPSTVPELVQAIQGVMLHTHWAERYGVQPSPGRKAEANLRFVHKQLAQIMALNPAPLTEARPVEQRVLGTCRDFSVFFVAVMRHKGIPARARCGFGTYFTPGEYGDHWVAEYWKTDKQRWVMVDAQLDTMQCDVLGIDFDTLDMPVGTFITAGEGWKLCRDGQADPEKFGIFDMHGLWFIRGNVVRDIAALNNMPLLPWDCWGLIFGEESDLSDADYALLDVVAEETPRGTCDLATVQALYREHEGLRVPKVIKSYVEETSAPVNLSTECEFT